MRKKFIEILEKEFDCLEQDLDFVIKKEGNTGSLLKCMMGALIIYDVVNFSLVTDDGFSINPTTDKVYWYMPYSTDGYPTYGVLEYNFKLERFTPCGWDYDIPVFKERKNIDKYIITREKFTTVTCKNS